MAPLMKNVRFHHYRRRPRLVPRGAKALAGVAVLLFAARAALPMAVEHYVNRTLDSLPGYRGSIKEVDIKLWRGAYQIREAKLEKADGETYAPFFYADTIDISVAWKELLQGALRAEIELQGPALNFVKGPTEETSQTKVDSRWQDRVDELVPLRIDRFELKGGMITYRDTERTPPIDVALRDVNLTALNLTNADRSSEELPASIEGTAKALDAALRLKMRVAPLADSPTFDLDASLRGLKLVDVNDFLRAYTGLDAEGGVLDLYVEAAASEGTVKGYVKPMFKNLKLIAWNDSKKGPLKFLKEAIAAATGELLENQPKDRIAARIPLQGKIDEPKAGIWPAALSVLRNAFIQALRPGVEGAVKLEGGQKKDKKS